MSREVWAVVSDLHSGSTLGLLSPSGVQLDDGQVVTPSEAQKKLWECWLTYREAVRSTLRAGDKLILLVNGDLVDGDHHRTAQIISKNLAVTQQRIAIDALLPLLELDPVAIHIIRGTEAHVGASAQWEEAIAEKIGAVRDPKTGTFSRWGLSAISKDCLLWFNHHGRMGTRGWTKMTGPGTMAAEIVMDCASHNERIPDLAVFGHCHQWGDTNDNFRTRVVQTAAWQLKTAFISRIAPTKLPAIGGVIITCDSGRATVEAVKFPWKRDDPWQLSE